MPQRYALAAGILALTFCATTTAGQSQPWESYADAVDAEVTRLVAEIELFRFRDDQLEMIRSLAYQEGVAVLCPGFVTDQTRLTDFLSQIVPMRDEAVRKAPLADVVLRSEVMFAFGTHFGATLAMGKADPAAFCARASAARRDPALVAPIWGEEK